MTVISHAKEFTTLDRKPDVRAATPGEFLRQRLADAAQRLSLAGEVAAHVELANEALHRLIYFVYEADTDGGPANICPVTFRFLRPAPWGSKGWKHWGLRKWEAGCLRAILLDRQAGARRTPPLFVMDGEARTWHLNYHEYNDIAHALSYLKKFPITLAEWRLYANKYRAGVTARRRGYSASGEQRAQ